MKDLHGERPLPVWHGSAVGRSPTPPPQGPGLQVRAPSKTASVQPMAREFSSQHWMKDGPVEGAVPAGQALGA